MANDTTTRGRKEAPERIIHHLQRNQWRMLVENSGSDEALEAVREMMETAVRDAVFVTGDDIATWAHTNPKFAEGVQLGVETGPIRLPFPVMWIEATPDTGRGASYAWIMFEAPGSTIGGPRPDGADDLIRVFCQPLIMVNSEVWWSDAADHLWVTEAGEVVQSGVMSLNDETVEVGRPVCDGVNLSRSLAGLTIVGFMNCRNVVVTPPDEAPIRHGKKGDRDKRIGLKPMGKIVVPGMTKQSTKAQVRDALGAPVAPHMVRGHFKRYTEENPLFGHITGTYWWGHHVRAGETAKAKPYEVRK